MDCTENGPGFTADEIRTLLKFASREEKDRNRYGVKMLVEGNRCWARAACDNQLELDGASDGQLPDGEWFVHRAYLERAVKNVVGLKAVLRLCFSGASLNHSIVEENGVETGSYDVPHEAALADISFPWANEHVQVPRRERRIAHCSAIPGAFAKLLEDVEAAVGVEYSDLYPPEDPDHPWVFVCNDGGQTVARGTLRAAKSAAATAGDGNEETAPSKRKRGSPKQQELPH